MADPTYALIWPRDLFDAEARQILEVQDDSQFEMILLLLEEAFEDDGVADFFRSIYATSSASSVWGEPTNEDDSVRSWFTELLKDEARLRPYEVPKYWAQRNSPQPPRASGPSESFATKFIELVVELSNDGYFPKVLPTYCPDGDQPTDEQISKQISNAIGLPFNWGAIRANPSHSTDDLIYSLVEYFHDQVQRPRTYWSHGYAGCEWHYLHHNALAGQAVYRWRVDKLLDDDGRPLRLAENGQEKGQLVREFSPSFQTLVESQLSARHEPDDEIAHAIRDFRSRGANIVAKRAAITLIANTLEARRQKLKVELKQDESDLFNIANNFQLRHRNVGQKDDYGHEFADWIFWNFLAAVELLDALERRGAETRG